METDFLACISDTLLMADTKSIIADINKGDKLNGDDMIHEVVRYGMY